MAAALSNPPTSSPTTSSPPQQPPRPPAVALGHLDDQPDFSIDVTIRVPGGGAAHGSVALRKITITVGDTETGAYVAVETGSEDPRFQSSLAELMRQGGFDVRPTAPDGVTVRDPHRSFFLEHDRDSGENAQNLFDRSSDFLLRLHARDPGERSGSKASSAALSRRSQNPIDQTVEAIIARADAAFGTRGEEPKKDWIAELYRTVDAFCTSRRDVSPSAVAETIGLHTERYLRVTIDDQFIKGTASDLQRGRAQARSRLAG